MGAPVLSTWPAEGVSGKSKRGPVTWAFLFVWPRADAVGATAGGWAAGDGEPDEHAAEWPRNQQNQPQALSPSQQPPSLTRTGCGLV